MNDEAQEKKRERLPNISVQMEPELKMKLEQVAKAQDRSAAAVTRIAIQEYLARVAL